MIVPRRGPGAVLLLIALLAASGCQRTSDPKSSFYAAMVEFASKDFAIRYSLTDTSTAPATDVGQLTLRRLAGNSRLDLSAPNGDVLTSWYHLRIGKDVLCHPTHAAATTECRSTAFREHGAAEGLLGLNEFLGADKQPHAPSARTILGTRALCYALVSGTNSVTNYRTCVTENGLLLHTDGPGAVIYLQFLNGALESVGFPFATVTLSLDLSLDAVAILEMPVSGDFVPPSD